MENIQQTAAFQGSWYACKGNFLISNHGSVQNKKQGVGGLGWRVTFLEQNTKHTAYLRAGQTFTPFEHVGLMLLAPRVLNTGETSQHNRLSPWHSGHSTVSANQWWYKSRASAYEDALTEDAYTKSSLQSSCHFWRQRLCTQHAAFRGWKHTVSDFSDQYHLALHLRVHSLWSSGTCSHTSKSLKRPVVYAYQ